MRRGIACLPHEFDDKYYANEDELFRTVVSAWLQCAHYDHALNWSLWVAGDFSSEKYERLSLSLALFGEEGRAVRLRKP